LVSVEISRINDAIFHSFILLVILVLVHVESTNRKRDHLLEVFGAIRTLQAQIELGKQIAQYEEQRRRMAAEHESCLEALRQENQRMIDEAVRVRMEYASAFMAAKTPTVEEIESAQSRHHYQTLKDHMAKKEQRLKDESAREKKECIQKENELKEAEEQIEQLRRDLSFLEEALESGSKRAVPTRSLSDSPVSLDTKRTKMEEPIQGCQTNVGQGQLAFASSNPIVSPKQDQTTTNQTQCDQSQINQTQSQTLGDQTQGGQTSEAQSDEEESFPIPMEEFIVSDSILSMIPQTEETVEAQNSIIPKEKPEGVQISIIQTKENESSHTSITPSTIIRSAVG
jgi:hypothetical protein